MVDRENNEVWVQGHFRGQKESNELHKFDGTQWHDVECNIPDGEGVVSMHKDAEGRLWMQTNGGRIGFIKPGEVDSFQELNYYQIDAKMNAFTLRMVAFTLRMVHDNRLLAG